MAMEASFALADPNAAPMKLTVIMPLGDWIHIREALRDDPHFHSSKSDFADAIGVMIARAHKDFYEEHSA